MGEFKEYLKFILKAVTIMVIVCVVLAAIFAPMSLAWFIAGIFA